MKLNNDMGLDKPDSQYWKINLIDCDNSNMGILIAEITIKISCLATAGELVNCIYLIPSMALIAAKKANKDS